MERLDPGVNKELVLIAGWQRPLHLVVVADQNVARCLDEFLSAMLAGDVEVATRHFEALAG